MTAVGVVLVGYYGRGNFGDDVLMVVAHRIVRELLPSESVGVRMGIPAKYPSQLLKDEVAVLPFGTRDSHRLIVHGGGGTFFDFAPHSWFNRLLNTALFSFGTTSFVQSERLIRSMLGRKRMSGRNRLGLGVGVGTYKSGSPRLRNDIPVLMEFDGLWLRDSESCLNLSSIGVSRPVVQGSDLAFLWDAWCPHQLVLHPGLPRGARPRVGVILRDWPSDSGTTFLRNIMPTIKALSSKYDLHLISLNPSADIATLNELNFLEQTLWNPESTEIEEFAEVIAKQDILLTARAHGAICGACLGRPSVILNIEPKLAAVNAMLPQATRLVSPSADVSILVEEIEQTLSIPFVNIKDDVKRNRAEAEKALVEILSKVDL